MASENTFRVGFGRICITPSESVPLAGYGNTSKRMSQSVTSDLYSTCLAFTDAENQTMLVFTQDLILTSAVWATPARQKVADATGVPLERILVCATHTHSGPDMLNTEQESILRYREEIGGLMAQAALKALADRAPARLYSGTTRIEKVNFVRHYLMDNGTYMGDNFGDPHCGKIVGSTTEADRIMQILRCVREDCSDVILVNWQTHPHRAGGSKRFDITADIVGAMRDEMEARLGCRFAYFSGAGGNVNSTSRVKELNLDGDYLVCGKYMAEHAIAAMETLKPIAAGKVQHAHYCYNVDTDHTMDHLAEIGLALRQEWNRTGDTAACIEAGRPYGIHSPYHAMAVYTKSKLPKTRDVDMTVLSMGQVAFVGAPYEMFDTNGQQIKWGSPFPTTFVCSCANDYVGYIPSAYGYCHGCYEADCTPIAPGSGEKLAMHFIKMLATLWNAQKAPEA